MSDYLPPIVIELTGHDAKAVAVLRAMQTRLAEFGAAVQRLDAQMTRGAEANARFSESAAASGVAAERAGTRTAAMGEQVRRTTAATRGLTAEVRTAESAAARFANKARLASEESQRLANKAQLAAAESRRLAEQAAAGGEGAAKLARQARLAGDQAERFGVRARMAGEHAQFLASRAAVAGVEADRLSRQEAVAAAETERLGQRATATSIRLGALGAAARGAAASNGVLSGSALRVGTAFASAGGTSNKLVAGLKKVGPAMAAVGIGVAVVSMKMAGDFQQETNILVTAAGEQASSLDKVRAGILSIARNTGSTWQDLTKGMYEAEKAGFHFANGGLTLVKAAAQGAREEGAPLNDVIGAMTTIMNNYHVPATKSVQVMNAMKTAAGNAKATFAEFSRALPAALPIAYSLGVSFEDVAGAMATMTQRGETARHAGDLLRGTMRSLGSPNQTVVKTLNQIGLSSLKVQHDLGKRGLTGTLKEISDAILKDMGPSGDIVVSTMKNSASATASLKKMLSGMPPMLKQTSQGFLDNKMSLGEWKQYVKTLPADQAAMAKQFATLIDQSHGFSDALKSGQGPFTSYTDMLRKVTGGQSGLQTALLLTGENWKSTTDNVRKVGASYRDSSKNVEGWESTQKLFNVQLDKFKQKVETAAISLGMKLLPFAIKVFTFLENHKTLAKSLAIGFGALAVALGAAAVAALLFSSPATMIAAGLALVAVGMVYLWTKSQTFREVLTTVFVAVTMPILGFARVAIAMFSLVLQSFLSFTANMLSLASDAFSWVPGIGPKLAGASKAVQDFSDGAGKFFDGAGKSIDGWEKKLSGMPNTIKLKGDVSDLSKKIAEAKKQLSDRNLPPEKRAKLTADIADWQQKLMKAKLQLETAPDKRKAILTAQIADWMKQIDTAKKQLASAPASKKAVLKAEIADVLSKVARAKRALNDINGQIATTYVHTVVMAPGRAHMSAAATGAVFSGSVRRMAAGGFGRPAMMAKGGSNILWGEGPDESYIPHTRTPRSRSIAERTVGILGGQVSWGGGAAAFPKMGAQVAAGLGQGMAGQTGALAEQARSLALAGVARPMAEALEIASPSKLTRRFGQWVGHGLVQGLTGTTGSVKAAAKRVAGDVVSIFGGRSHILRVVNRDNDQLLSLASKRDQVAGKLKAAQKHLADLRKSWSDKKSEIAQGIMSGVSVITSANEDGRPVNAADVLTHLKQQAQKAMQFAQLLKQLRSKGLRSDLIQQLAAAGPEQGYDTALALAGGSSGQIREVNATQKNLVAAANSTGSVVADAMYGAGIKSAQGLIRGLASQEKAIQRQMLKIAKAMEAAIKYALGIRSPSRVMAQLGDYTAQGYAMGIDRSSKHAAIAAAGMAMSVRQAATVTAGTGRLAVGSGPTASGGGGQHFEVHIHVAGSVLSERELRTVVEQQMLRLGMRNSGTYVNYSR